MKCSKCGKDLMVGQDYCYSCGTMNKKEETTNPNQPSDGNNKTKLIIIIVAVVAIIAVIALVILSNKDESNDNNGGNSSGGSSEVETTKKKEKGTTLKFGENAETKNAEFNVEAADFSKKVVPPKASGYYSYYSADDGKVYLDVIFEYKNTASSDVKASEIIEDAKIIYKDNYTYTGFSIIEEDSRSDFTYSNITYISPLTTEYVHYLFALNEDVEEDSGKLLLQFKIDGKLFEVLVRDGKTGSESTTKKNSKKDKNKEIGEDETQTVDGVAEFSIDFGDLTSKVVPPKASGYYSYYAADDGKVYFDLCVKYKNLKNDDVDADEVIKAAKLTYNSKYEYTGFSIIEEDSRSDFTYSNITSIAPLATEYVHYLFELPESVKDGGSIKVNFGIGDSTYVYNFK